MREELRTGCDIKLCLLNKYTLPVFISLFCVCVKFLPRSPIAVWDHQCSNLFLKQFFSLCVWQVDLINSVNFHPSSMFQLRIIPCLAHSCYPWVLQRMWMVGWGQKEREQKKRGQVLHFCNGQTADDCLMLWKLTRVGEVGIDMARATRARIECLSCQRCHRLRTAERTSLFKKQ